MATATEMVFATKMLLAEATNSTVGDVGSGTGTVATGGDTDTTIEGFLTEGAAELCRSAYFLPGFGEKASYTAGQKTFDLSGLTMSSTYSAEAGIIWYPLTVTYNGVHLLKCGEPELRAFKPDFEIAATGTPKYYYRLGDNRIGIYPSPTNSSTLAVYGAAVPFSLGDGTGGTVTEYTFLPDELLLRILPAYAAGKIAFRNTDDPSILERAFWKDWYEAGKAEMWLRLDGQMRGPNAVFGSMPPAMSSKEQKR